MYKFFVLSYVVWLTLNSIFIMPRKAEGSSRLDSRKRLSLRKNVVESSTASTSETSYNSEEESTENKNRNEKERSPDRRKVDKGKKKAIETTENEDNRDDSINRRL